MSNTPRPEAISVARTGDRDGGGKRGFALIEVMLALMLIASLAAIVMPGLVRATGPGALRVTAMEVSALLRGIRNVALSSGRTAATEIEAGAVRSAGSGVSVKMPFGVAVVSNTTNIRFFADGRSSGGLVVIASKASHVVVNVNPDTGSIRVTGP